MESDRPFWNSRNNARLILGVATALALFGSLSATAAEFIVTTVDDTNAQPCSASACSLRAAILAANASGEASTVRLGVGNYWINLAGAGEDEGLLGDFDINSDVTIIGAGVGVTRIGTSYLGEQIIDVAAGSTLRLQNLTVGVGIRTGRFGSGDADNTRLEVNNTVLGGSQPGDTISAKGSLLVKDSIISGGSTSNGQSAIRFEGKRLDINQSTIQPGSIGVSARMSADGQFSMTDSSIAASGQRIACASIDVYNASSITVVRSQALGAFPAEMAPSCLRGEQISIRDSAFKTHDWGNKALLVSGNTRVQNSTIAGSISIGGPTALDHVTVGGTVTYGGEGPNSIEGSSSSVSVSNSVLIGACAGGSVTAFGNNVESPGNTCGFAAASNRINQTHDSLELSLLQLNGGTTLNYLPGNASVLNRVYTADGIARCATTDQRGFVRADICTIGAVESAAAERVLFRHGFDD